MHACGLTHALENTCAMPAAPQDGLLEISAPPWTQNYTHSHRKNEVLPLEHRSLPDELPRIMFGRVTHYMMHRLPIQECGLLVSWN